MSSFESRRKRHDFAARYSGIPDHLEALSVVFGIIIAAAIIGAVALRVLGFFKGDFFGSEAVKSFWIFFVEGYLPLMRFMSVVLSIALIVFVVYVTRERNKILAAERNKLRAPLPDYISTIKAREEKDQEAEIFEFENKRWQRVIGLINSQEPRDWKIAILEADIMLGELLDTMGYRGDSMGDQLKKIEKSDFLTIDKAWEAHKIRNSIAHEGEDFLITHREAQRVMRLFEEVFLEFRYI